MRVLDTCQSLQHWSAKIDQTNIVWLELGVADKSVNVLTRAVFDELTVIVDALEATSQLAGVALLSAKPGGFVYGADINEFEDLKNADEVAGLMRLVHGLFDRIATLPVPTAAGIDGIAVGGGLEIALPFDRLFATRSPKTKLGFPEVNLGIMPGYGGTGRAFARVGTAAVLDLMLGGKPVGIKAALAMGLVDAEADNGEALAPAIGAWIVQQNGTKPTRAPVEKSADAEALTAARDRYLKRLRQDHTPAPFAILAHVQQHGHDPKAMSAGEIDIFPGLLTGLASKNLRRVFYLTDSVRKTGRGDSQISNIHVVGAGVMGGDIAAVSALSGMTVTLTDMDAAAIDAARSRARILFERRLKTDNKITSAMARLIADPDGQGASTADLIIEAVAERLDVKQAVFKALENVAKAGAILATNTSAIPLEDIASALHHPERLIGLHFFNPVPVLPLVEVIWSRLSDPDLVNRGMQFAGSIGKMPIRCKSSPGFLVNRALLPYIYKAIDAVAAGENPDLIDQSLVDFGMPMGPIELADQIGLDVCLDVGLVLGISPVAKRLLTEKCAAGTIGRKSSRGFYQWDGNRTQRPRAAGDAATMETLVNTMLAPMIEACRQAVDDGVVDSADNADAGMIFGIGFPGFRGGPLHWADGQ